MDLKQFLQNNQRKKKFKDPRKIIDKHFQQKINHG